MLILTHVITYSLISNSASIIFNELYSASIRSNRILASNPLVRLRSKYTSFKYITMIIIFLNNSSCCTLAYALVFIGHSKSISHSRIALHAIQFSLP